MADFRRTIDDIVQTLKNAKARKKSCSLLIGAGCSVKAGIPTAAGFVEIIKERYPLSYNRAAAKSYPKCMAELTLGERRDLIAEYIDNAKINWAHICLGLLIQAGYVDRVLTTNFDLLVIRACSLLGEFPATYDFAASQLLKAADIPDKAVFYLHGQRTGFVLMNTEDECNKHSKLMSPVFEDAGRGRLWVVVGYSGENDPVFDHLAEVPRFDNGLYWVGYEDNEPGKHVLEKLLVSDKDAFYANGFDADSFFITLTQKLSIFPPKFLAAPFSHMDDVLKMLTPYSPPKQTSEEDVTRLPRQWMQEAIQQFERRPSDGGKIEGQLDSRALAVLGQTLFMAGKYDEVIGLQPLYNNNPSPQLADSLTWSYVMQGIALADQAKNKSGEEADRLYKLAEEKYQAALAIKPAKHEALSNWGLTLADQAGRKSGEEADRLYKLAEEKYQATLAIKPDSCGELNNWGLTLADQARRKSGEEADRLYKLAEEKYQAALAIKPAKHEALSNWGLTLADQAGRKSGEEADRLYKLAEEKYQAALAIKPDSCGELNNWGLTLADQARRKSGEEADRLYKLAEEKYQAALAIKPDSCRELNNWGIALAEQAKSKSGKEADRLYKLAGEKYQGALAIKPDMHEALNNWGLTLADQAKSKSGEEADRLYKLAGEKYQATLAIKPDKHEALNNWGIALADQAKSKSGEEADRLYKLAGEKYQATLAIKPDKHEALCNWGVALAEQAKSKSGEEADRLFKQAVDRLRTCETLKSGFAAYNLACLSALLGIEDDARQWLEKSKQSGTLPSRAHLEGDRDLDSLSGTQWFQTFLTTVEG